MRISDWSSDWSSDVCSSDLLPLCACHIAARSAHWPKPEFQSPCVCQHPDGYGHCRCVADRRVVGMGCLDVGFRSDPGLLGEGGGQYDCYSLFRPAQFQLPGHWRHGWVRRIVAGFSTVDHGTEPVRYPDRRTDAERSEEHTSELQSLMRISYDVSCFKNKTPQTTT